MKQVAFRKLKGIVLHTKCVVRLELPHMLLWIVASDTVLSKNFRSNYLFSCPRRLQRAKNIRTFIAASLSRVFLGNSVGSTVNGTHGTNIHPGMVVHLEDEETQHLRARRIEENQVLEVFDGSGYVGRAILLGYSKGSRRSAEILVQSWAMKEEEQLVKLTVGVGLPKAKRGDWLMEKLSEIGVDTVIPIHYERTNSEPYERDRKQRWQKICISACKQCCRNRLMKIEEEQSFQNILSKQQVYKHWDQVYVASMEATRPMILPPVKSTSILALIGPEGGLTPQEEKIASDVGAHFIKLNRYILRVETAAIVLASQIFSFSDHISC